MMMTKSCSSYIEHKCIGPYGINFKKDDIQELRPIVYIYLGSFLG